MPFLPGSDRINGTGTGQKPRREDHQVSDCLHLLGAASNVIGNGHNAVLAGAVGAAVEGPLGFDSVTDDLALAVLAHRGEFVNRAFEAVERMGLPSGNDLK